MSDAGDRTQGEEYEPVGPSERMLRYGGITSRPGRAPDPKTPLWMHILAGALLLALLAGTSLLIVDVRRRFPVLPPGAYLGAIEGLGEEDGRFYIERAAGSPQLFVVMLHEGWDPQLVEMFDREGKMSAPLPLTVVGPGTTISFVGTDQPAGVFRGRVERLGATGEGRWELRPLIEESLPLSNKELGGWLALRGELEQIEVKLAAYHRELQRKSEERDRLQAFVGDTGTLAARAASKLAEEQSSLDQARVRLDEIQRESRERERELRLASRVTPMGRLASLARESLERDARWYESRMRKLDRASRLELAPGELNEWRALIMRVGGSALSALPEEGDKGESSTAPGVEGGKE